MGYLMNQARSESERPELSVVVPIYNEEECLPGVLDEIREAFDEAGMKNWEVVAVDDGSRDRSAELIGQVAAKDGRFRMLRFVRNAGQTAAFDAGLRAARGRLIGMMDGDGQNDPHDFPRLIAAMREQGVDLMNGVRAKRQDSWVRRVSSRIANGVRNRMTGEHVTDVGCAIRVFRRECIERVKLFNGMHRFFPTLVRIEGYTIGEIAVNHRPRTKGQSKYGKLAINSRLWRGLYDLFAVRWMQGRTIRYEIRKD
jgi:dolichol-phosphate mannosyltransferase